MDERQFDRVRVILYHKQATSARSRFLRYGNDSVLAFSPLPALAQLLDDEPLPPGAAAVVEYHPAMVLKRLAQSLDLPPEALALEPGYHRLIATPHATLRVLLVSFATIDPPFAQVEAVGARFIDLTQARDLPPLELLLLRRAYEVIMEG